MFRRLLCGIAPVFSMAAASPADDWAQKLLATTDHDFGSVARGAKAEFAFTITNNLQSDVHIASVRSSCGCTSPTIANDKRTLKTYESGAIIAHLNSDTHVGKRAATLTLIFDQPQYAEVQLHVHAYVHTNLLMEPASLQFGALQQGKGGEALVRLYRADLSGWQINPNIRFSDPNLQGQAVLVARQGSQTWYDLKVRLAATAPPGYISDYAVLTTNDPNMAQVPIQVEGQVRPNVVISPADLFLGVVHTGQTVTKPLVVRRADRPFRIEAITGDKSSFEIPKPPSDARLVHVVPVTFVAGAEIGKVVKTIHITTDIGGAEATSYAVVNEDVK